MKTKVGLWIDLGKAIVMAVKDKGEEMGSGNIAGTEIGRAQ
jgi:hypothetical protein